MKSPSRVRRRSWLSQGKRFTVGRRRAPGSAVGLPFPDRAVHPFDLTVGPGGRRLRQAVPDPARHRPRTDGGPWLAVADHVEAHRPGEGRVPVPRRPGAPDAAVGQDGANPAGRAAGRRMPRDLPGGAPVRLLRGPGDGGLAGSVDADDGMEPARGGLHLGDVDVKEADRAALEPPPFRLVVLDAPQAGEAFVILARTGGATSRIAAGNGAVPTASEAQSGAEGHGGGPPGAAACGDHRLPRLGRHRRARLLSVRSPDPRRSPAGATSRPSSG